jgi:hypothetical protein
MAENASVIKASTDGTVETINANPIIGFTLIRKKSKLFLRRLKKRNIQHTSTK